MTQSLEKEIGSLRSLFWSERDPEGRVFAPLADAYRRAGDFRQALRILTEGLDRHPDFSTGHVVAARLYLEKGLYAEAGIAARAALDLDAENTAALDVLAGAADATGHSEEAERLRAELRSLEEARPRPEGEEAGHVVDIRDLAPDGPIVGIEDLAPDVEWASEPVGPAASPAWDQAESALMLAAPPAPDALPAAVGAGEDEAWIDIADLAPEVPVVDVLDLMPEEDAVGGHESEPDPIPVEEGLPSVDLTEAEPVLTRTMAELYVEQGLTDRAVGVYRELLKSDPDNDEVLARLAELEGVGGRREPVDVAERAPASGDAADSAGPTEDEIDDGEWSDPLWGAEDQAVPHEVDTPFAWTDEEPEDAGEGPPIGSFFQQLLAWQPDVADDPPHEEGGSEEAGEPESGRDGQGGRAP